MKYEIYGSNETGFTPRREAQPVLGLGPAEPPNLIATVTAPQQQLAVHPLAQAFYRVVAVDAAGTRGGASQMAAIPRPCVYSCPATAATVGKPYSDTMIPSLAIGDLQFREAPGVSQGQVGQHYAEREGARFTAHTLPSWLKLTTAPNGTAGHLSGAPTSASQEKVAILVSVTYPHDCSPLGQCDPAGPWKKDTPLFEKSCWHNFSITVA